MCQADSLDAGKRNSEKDILVVFPISETFVVEPTP